MRAGSESRRAALGASRRYAASPPDPQDAMRAGSESRRAALGASRRYAASPPDPQGRSGLLEGGDELAQQQRVVALDGAGHEVLGPGRVFSVPDVEEHLLRGLEEAVGVLGRLARLHLA